ncbi:MAG: DUF2809 domain-containing protein [Deinococcales bacterium]|nr:DUF2809 domain-containing protein [Chitinophagaceae bacterium]
MSVTFNGNATVLFTKSIYSVSILVAAINALIFAYNIEVLQYYNMVNLLRLQQLTNAKVIIGIAFTWLDLVAYTAGIILVLLLQKVWLKNTSRL